MFELTVDSQFSAAHFLKGYEGDCARMHGHTWKVSVTVSAIKTDETGMCIDFKNIAAHLDAIVDRFDHRNLNELEFFRDKNPTAENLAKLLYEVLSKKIKDDNVSVRSVTVHESDRYRVTYEG
ncbi:6-carboxytetrahydropterin synthase QueD [Candidatus Latescibacterota bacterium]